MLFVEFEIIARAGVSDGAAPDLFADAGVAAKGEDFRGAGLADDADGFEDVAQARPVSQWSWASLTALKRPASRVPMGLQPVMRWVSTKK